MAQDDLVWLKDFLQDDLYLVADDIATFAETIIMPPPIETPAVTFNCLGPVDSGFLIIVNYPEDEHIPARHLQPLENILTRKNIMNGDFTIVNTANNNSKDYRAIIDYFSPKKIVMMGNNNAMPDGLSASGLNTVTEDKGIKILATDSFSDLLLSEDKKRAFWAEMKNF